MPTKLEGKERVEFEFMPLTLSIETAGGVASPVVPRGTPLPTERSQFFSTAADNQTIVETKVLLGERMVSRHNLNVGSFRLEEIPPAPRGRPQIQVTFKVDRNCEITVEAAEKSSGQRTQVAFEQKGLALDATLVEFMLKQAEENKDEDKARALVSRAELRIRDHQQNVFVSDGTKRIEVLVADIGLALMKGDKKLMIEKTGALEEAMSKAEEPLGDYGGLFEGLFGQPVARKRFTPKPSAQPASIENPPAPSQTQWSPLAILEAMQFHPKVIEVSRALFRDGHYTNAILAAFIEVCSAVKKKSGSKLDGKALMATVFSEEKPVISINNLASQSDHDEQEGFKFLFMGAQVGIRNPKAHDNSVQTDPYTTIEYLGLASLLMKRVEEGKVTAK